MPELCAAIEKRQPLDEVSGLILNTPEGQVRTSPRARPKDLSTTPPPKRDLPGVFRNKYYLALQRPTALMEVSRGCPFQCNFCSIWKFAESRVRSLSVEAAVAELAAVPENAVFFVDDHFFRVSCQLLRRKK